MDSSTPNYSFRQQLVAAFLVFLGAIMFSTKAVMVKLAYRYEVDSISLLALRMIFSLPLFLLIAQYDRRKQQESRRPLTSKEWIYTFGLGVMGYYLASLFDFIGLNYISAGMERLILFLYPTIVVLLSAILFKEKIGVNKGGALLLTYAGVAIAFAQNVQQGEEDNLWLGAGLILVSAFTYAIYLLGSGQFLPKLGTLRFTSLAMMGACTAVIIHHGIVQQWQLFGFPAPVYYLSMLMAIFATVVPSFLISEGIRLIGASNAAVIGSVGPISTIILAYIFLGESFGGWQWLGTFLVIGGVLMISLQKHRSKA